MSTKNKPVVESTTEPKFTKEILVNSKRFHNKQDIVSALLKDGVEYTVSDVEGMIEKYMKGKVK